MIQTHQKHAGHQALLELCWDLGPFIQSMSIWLTFYVDNVGSYWFISLFKINVCSSYIVSTVRIQSVTCKMKRQRAPLSLSEGSWCKICIFISAVRWINELKFMSQIGYWIEPWLCIDAKAVFSRYRDYHGKQIWPCLIVMSRYVDITVALWKVTGNPGATLLHRYL